MLTAIQRRKARNGRRFNEDEITSTVLGPLRFMRAEEAWDALRLVGILVDKMPPDFAPASHEMRFWPRLKREGRPGYLEPDLVIEFENEAQSRFVLLIEIKWESRLGGLNDYGDRTQLAKQWVALRHDTKYRDLPAEHLQHLYLTRQMPASAAGVKETENLSSVEGFDRKEWSKRIHQWSWMEIQRAASRTRTDTSPSVACWLDVVAAFLAWQDVAGFQGFAHLPKIPCALDPLRIFRRSFDWPEINPGNLEFNFIHQEEVTS